MVLFHKIGISGETIFIASNVHHFISVMHFVKFYETSNIIFKSFVESIRMLALSNFIQILDYIFALCPKVQYLRKKVRWTLNNSAKWNQNYRQADPLLRIRSFLQNPAARKTTPTKSGSGVKWKKYKNPSFLDSFLPWHLSVFRKKVIA